MKYIKEELEKMIFIENKSYREIGRFYNVSDSYIKRMCNKLGIILPCRSVFPKDFVPANKGKRKTKICKNCENIIETSWAHQKFCNNKCFIEYKSKKIYEDFINNNNKYCKSNYQLRPMKKFILLEQDNKCAICNMDNMWNNKLLIFVMDHIDGDASNNKRENLRLICPNCDSQLDTFKSKNKNSARKERYISLRK